MDIETKPQVFSIDVNPESDQKAEKPDILTILETDNVAELLDEKELTTIGMLVVQGYLDDDQTRQEWKQKNEKFQKLVMGESVRTSKPFQNASDYVYPLASQACIEYQAMAYPQIVQNGEIVKGKVVLDNVNDERTQRAIRVGKHMTYQLDCEMKEWKPGLKKILGDQFNWGTSFRKTYQNPVEKRPFSEMRFAKNVVMNYYSESLEKAPRITDDSMGMSKNELIEKIRSGEFLDILDKLGSGDESAPQEDGTTNKSADEDKIYNILEQHRFLDIDGDEYQEPYIVTVHQETESVLRIEPRFDYDSVYVSFNDSASNDSVIIRLDDIVAYWEDIARSQQDGFIVEQLDSLPEKYDHVVKIIPHNHFTKFDLLPALDGSIYGWGMGMLLTEPNIIINGLLNRLMDAGALANDAGGFYDKRLKFDKDRKEIEFGIGEWKGTDWTLNQPLSNAFFPKPVPQPSPVLFQILGVIMESSARLAKLTDAMLGDNPPANQPAATTLALIDQGMRLYSYFILNLHDGLKVEFEKIYRLNQKYIDNPQEFATYADGKMDYGNSDSALMMGDYQDSSTNIIPVSDPKTATKAQEIVKSQAVMQIAGSAPQFHNLREILIWNYRNMGIDEPERFVAPPEAFKPQPDPKMQTEMLKQSLERNKAADEAFVNQKKLEIEAAKAMAEIQKMNSETLLNMQQAKASEQEIIDVKNGFEEQKQLIDDLLNLVRSQAGQIQKGMEANAGNQQQSTGVNS